MPLSTRRSFTRMPNAARFVRQERLDGGPFRIAEFVAHDPRLQFRSMKVEVNERAARFADLVAEIVRNRLAH
jgi:hypothetical protein